MQRDQWVRECDKVISKPNLFFTEQAAAFSSSDAAAAGSYAAAAGSYASAGSFAATGVSSDKDAAGFNRNEGK